MAEKRFLKGLFKDTGYIDQPEGTWRHAKNMILNEKTGSISNEGGTELSGYLGSRASDTNPSNTGDQESKVIGKIEISENRTILFLVNITNSLAINSAPSRSEIGMWQNDRYYPIFNPVLGTVATPDLYISNDLGFNLDYPIEGTFKIDSKGDLIIYWTDDLNPPRAFNIDRQLRESGDGTLAGMNTVLNISKLYGIAHTSLDNIDILNLFPYSGPVPHVDVDDQGTHQNCVIEGGGLLTATYYLALAYVDDDLVATNYLTVSNPISIVDEFDHTTPTNKKDGAKHGSQTTKSIKWEISNLNVDYKYLRPIVIRSMGDAKEAFKLNDLTFTTSTTTVIFSGLEASAAGSVEEVIIDTISYDTAKTIQQLDDVLYLGNTTKSIDLGYQKYANNIKLRSRVDEIKHFDTFYASLDNLETGWGTRPVNSFGVNGNNFAISQPNPDPTKSYRYVPNIFKYKGYMRDEIYAFYIAFIMKDGSMSYAYHIPGREDLYKEKDSVTTLGSGYGRLWGDVNTISPDNGFLFHWMDTYTHNISQGSYSLSTSMGMNYWENATEFYPNTENYEVWDNTSGGSKIGTLQNLNVRHHHFPSNRNAERKSIDSAKLCRTTKSSGSGDADTGKWKGKFAMLDGRNDKFPGSPTGQKYLCACNGDWTRNAFEHTPTQAAGLCSSWGENGPNGYDNEDPNGPGMPGMRAALWNRSSASDTSGSRFTADQTMDVRVRFLVVHRQDGSGNDPNEPIVTRVRTNTLLGGVQTLISDSDPPDIKWNCCGHNGTNCSGQTSISGSTGENFIGFNASGGSAGTWSCGTALTENPSKPSVDWSAWVTLNAGDTIWVESSKTTTSGKTMYQTGYDYYAQSCATTNGALQGTEASWGFSFVEFDIVSAAAFVPDEDYHDAKIDHHVTRLGFDLEDIKIPQSIADQVQGFRIYYANRKHSDRTVLGQSILIPGMYKKEVLGLCAEASAGSVNQAAQVLSGLQTAPESFYNVDPWARMWSDYPALTHDVENGNQSNSVDELEESDGDRAMDMFSFHDFYLLRTKNSLAGATHINIEYYVQNLAWNGSGLDQDKKMVTLLSSGKDATGSTDPDAPLTVKEVWGWDPDQNCYPQKMKTAFFAGAFYNTPSSRTQPRLLGQKSKTYLLGDSIFQGKDLGFGGKLFNEFGESCIALRLKDNHGIGAWKVKSYPDSPYIGYFADVYGGNSQEAIDWGAWDKPHGAEARLLNTLDSTGAWRISNTTGGNTASHGVRSQNVMANLKAFKTDVYKSIDSQELVWTGFEVLGGDLNEYVFNENGDMTGTGNTIDTHPDGIYGGDTFICRYGITPSLKPSNESQDSEPEKATYFHIVESTDNINFRSVEDNKSLFFPNSVLRDLLRNAGQEDFHFVDNLKYNANYSEVNDIRPAFPLPIRDMLQSDFPTRTHRSTKNDTTSLIDNYRVFLANEFKDLPKNRGDLWKLSSFNNLLYFHMQESLFASKGKQQMQMKDGSEAFVGSGDIFQQDPDEIIQTKGGYGGTQSQWAALTSRYGYFFVDQDSRKVFLMKDKLSEISALGMEDWFEANLKVGIELEPYGFNSSCTTDNPILGLGLTSTYDPKFKRIILTKRDVAPTQALRDGILLNQQTPVQAGAISFNPKTCKFRIYFPCLAAAGQSCVSWTDIDFKNKAYFTNKGWTISYYPELNIWGSFHDYVPYMYFNTSTDFYSLTDKYPIPSWVAGTLIEDHVGTTYGNAGIWKHNSMTNHGILYQENNAGRYSSANWLTSVSHYPFEFEFIHNETKAESSLLGAFNYTLETFNQEKISVLEHGFTSFFIYNTFQLSGIGQDWLKADGTPQVDSNGTALTSASISSLEYLVNTRRIGNNWKINNFRDMASAATNTDSYYMSTNTNVIGGTNTGTITTSSTDNMFIYNGMHKTVNATYLDLSKNWNLQRKFIDKWVGIRLIYDNITNNFLNLYSTDVAVRKSHR